MNTQKKPYKVYIHENALWDYELIFTFSEVEYELVDESCQDIDFFVMNEHPYHSNVKARVKLWVDVHHNYDEQYSFQRKWYREKVVACDPETLDNNNHYMVSNCTNRGNKDPIPNYIFVDFLFNICHCYFFDLHKKTWEEFGFRRRPFMWIGDKRAYTLPKGPRTDGAIYVAPNKTFKNENMLFHTQKNHVNREGRHLEFRRRLVDLLKQEPWFSKGYLGNADDTEGLALAAEFDHPELPIEEVKKLKNVSVPFDDQYRISGYSPPCNSYFTDTFISIYGETVEVGTSTVATEKTFWPMMKKHFVLPISSCGFIQHCKDHWNFKFPDFIDYSYSDIEDDEERCQAYLEEVKRVLSIPFEEWKKLYYDNQDIIEHNYNILVNKPYEKIDFESLLEKHPTPE